MLLYLQFRGLGAQKPLVLCSESVCDAASTPESGLWLQYCVQSQGLEPLPGLNQDLAHFEILEEELEELELPAGAPVLAWKVKTLTTARMCRRPHFHGRQPHGGENHSPVKVRL